jgi:PKD repeat protein
MWLRKKAVLSLFLVCIMHLPAYVLAQAGKNGAKIVSSSVFVNEYTVLTANANSGNTSINVVSTNLNSSGLFPSALAPGDLLLIIQMQGALIAVPDDSTYGAILNYGNCGNYEFAQVASVASATVINLSCALNKAFSATGKTQVVRVPRYSSLTINSTGIVSCPAWNGVVGGVMAAEVQGNTIINSGGSIDVSSKGFRGGALLDNVAWWGVGNFVSTLNDYGAEKGEGIAGYQLDYDALGGRYAKGAPANGGGGANSHNAGGGGGGNAGATGSWTGRGNPNISNAGWISAWNREYAGFSASTSSGGGKGGYTFSASNQDATLIGPSNSAWGGDQRADQGGRGGRPLNYSTGKIFLGGGGGSGDQNNNAGGAGGIGGGIAILLAYGDVSGAGTIRANGANGANTIGANGTDGAGGGGAGGAILVPALGAISGISISANGGAGGTQTVSFGTLEAEGPGGGGGGGYIAVSNGAITKSAAGGLNGTTNSFSLTEFPPNGATSGGSGESSAILPVFKIVVNSPQTVCTGSAATITFSTVGTPPTGTNLGWYSSSIGGTLLASGNTYTTPPITGTVIVYVGSCPGVYRQPVLLNANTVTSSFTSTTVCQGNATTFNASAGSSMGTINGWSWDFGDGSGTSTLQNPTYTYTLGGSYTVVLTATDDLGCSSVTTNTVVVNPRPGISATASPASGCLPLNVQFNNTSTNANSYTWNFGDGSATSSQTSPAHVYANAGTYTVTVTASNAAGCTSSQSFSNMVQASATPRATFTASSNTVCLGDTVRFTDASFPNGTIITSRSWNFGDGSAPSNQTNPSHAYMTAGSYLVRLTVSSATCSHDTTLTILVNPGPVVSFSSSVNVGCNPLSVSFTNTTSGAPIYSWNFGDGSPLSSTSSPSHVYAGSGTYSVTLIATQGSCADTLRVQSMIVVYPTPGASFNSASSICLGDTVFFANNSTSSGGITGYSWDFGDGSASSTASNPYHVYGAPGSYSVTLRCSTNQCTDDTVKTIVVSPAPVASFTSSLTSGCSPLNISFTNTTGGSATYSWIFGDGGTSSATSPSHTYNTSGSYDVTLIAVQGSCSDTLKRTNLISVANKPTALFTTSPQLCLGDTLFTSNNSMWNGSPSGTYVWNFGDGSPSSNLSSPFHVYQSAGTYTLSLTANSALCSDDSLLNIVVAPAPQASFSVSANSVCHPQSIQFNNTTSGSPVYNWNFGDGSPSSSLTNPSHTYSTPGTYSVTLIAAQGSCSDTLSMPGIINVLASPLADFSYTSPCINDSVVFTNLTQSQGSTISSYSWDFGDGSAAGTLQNVKHAYLNAGTYTVRLIVQSTNGCSDTISKSVTILTRPQVAFSPDVMSGCDSLTVHFNNTSTGAVLYNWNFGDGGTSTLTNPSHTFNSAGSYTVLLTAEASGGCSSSRAYVNLIVVRSTPSVQFSSSQTTICSGDCISFADLSSGGVNTWNWSFQGANPSSASNSSPANVCYPGLGVFDVSLNVSDGFCSSSTTSAGLIHVVDCSAMPVASFIASDTFICGGSCLTFVSLSLNATSWTWSFPGATPSGSSLESPMNICYQSQGIFPVSLVASNSTGSDTMQVTGFIQVFPGAVQPNISQLGDSLWSSTASSYQWYLNGIPISGATSQSLVAPLSGNYSVETWDVNGCSSLSNSRYVSLVGIEEDLRSFYLLPFPVPCHDELQLHLYSTYKGKVNMKLIDALGQEVLNLEENMSGGENHFLMNTEKLSPGVYLLRMQFGTRVIVRRIARG